MMSYVLGCPYEKKTLMVMKTELFEVTFFDSRPTTNNYQQAIWQHNLGFGASIATKWTLEANQASTTIITMVNARRLSSRICLAAQQRGVIPL